MSDGQSHLVCGPALEQATASCVFVHGRGQSPEIMRESILARVQMRSIHFVLPRASTGSWYDAKAVDPLTSTTRAQLSSSLQVLRQVIEQLPRHLPLLLAGFSQGACLALEYAMAHGPWQGGLACFTGCRVGTMNDDRAKSDLAGLPVYLSGSDADPWIPVKAFAEATVELAASRARLRCDVIPGRGHDVSATEAAVLDATLAQLALGQNIKWSEGL
jgi:phospholipase/carboxylesterase